MVNWGDVPTWLAFAGAFLGGGAALWQLRLQRIQLTDQTRIQERQQANAIDVAGRPVDGAQAQVLPASEGESVHMVVVANGSDRPIREVACKIEAIEADEKTRRQKPADVCGEVLPMALGPSAQVETFVAPSSRQYRAGASSRSQGRVCLELHCCPVPALSCMG